MSDLPRGTRWYLHLGQRFGRLSTICSAKRGEMPTPTVVMLYPGHSAEDEYAVLAGSLGDVALPVLHTWEGPTAHDVEALLELGSKDQMVAAAGRARELGPDAVMWACTSGSFVYGPRGVHEQAGWIESAAGVPASSTSIAFQAAMRHLGLRHPSVTATYPEAVTRPLHRTAGSRRRRSARGDQRRRTQRGGRRSARRAAGPRADRRWRPPRRGRRGVGPGHSAPHRRPAPPARGRPGPAGAHRQPGHRRGSDCG